MEKRLDQPDRILGTFSADLSKAYYCIKHELTIAKLAAYGLNTVFPLI